MKGKRLISVLLSLVLVLNIAFVIEGKADAANNNQSNVKYQATETAKLTGKQVTGKARNYERKSFKAKTIINTGSSNQAYTYVNDLPSGYFDVVKVSVANTGYLYLDYIVESLYATTANIGIYVVDEENMLLATSHENFDFYDYHYGLEVGEKVTNAGKDAYTPTSEERYVIVDNKGSDNVVSVGIRGKVFTTGTRNLAQGTSKYTLASAKNKSGGDSTTWFKVKPDRTGVMTVSLKEYGITTYGTVRLYNSSKGTALSNPVNGSKAYFGVKKGTTYYLKVTNCQGFSDYNYRFGIKYGMTSRTDRDLNSKSEAKELTRKADATNTLFKASTSTSSSATTDWYKIYVSSKRKTRITVNASGMSSGEMKVTLYKGSTKIGSDTIKAGYKGTFKITTNYSDYATKGTYYVKIVKSKMCSGKYSIRYDQ